MSAEGRLERNGAASDAMMTLRARIADYRGRGIYAGYPNQFRCIFIHVPKTAGSSIAQALFGESSRHVPYFEYERANPRKFRSYFKFAFVRNPWDRLVSAYFFLRRGGMNELDRTWAERHLKGYPTFETFVRGWLNAENVMSFPHFRPQAFYVADRQGQLMVDVLGRYENLAQDFVVIARRVGRECVMPVGNKSSHLHYASYYDDETREIVRSVYSRDIELFGYRFD